MKKVHIVYYPHGEKLFSRGINLEGDSVSDCVKQFEGMEVGEVFNITVKEGCF